MPRVALFSRGLLRSEERHGKLGGRGILRGKIQDSRGLASQAGGGQEGIVRGTEPMGPMNLNINSLLSGVGTGQRGPSLQGQVIGHCFGRICLWRDHEPHPLMSIVQQEAFRSHRADGTLS